MKILLLGEFSALHKNLKEGLVGLGHEVTIIASGDGWKKIPCDINVGVEGNGYLAKIKRRMKLFSVLLRSKNYDVVQIVNVGFIGLKFFPVKFILDRLIKKNGKVFLLAAGDDAFFWKFGRERLKYHPLDESLRYDLKQKKSIYESKFFLVCNKYIVNCVRGIIPVMYEYQICYKEQPNLLAVIPIPVNVDLIAYEKNIIKDKITIFHGLNRPGFKGTRHVEEAFKILKERYPEELELIIEGNLPLDEYLKLMKRTNVVIDQLYSHSCGVNAIYALAMGKVVMGGGEPESLSSLNIESSPVINLNPNANSIIEEVEKLLNKKGEFVSMGYASRQFAERVHGHLNIAEKYINSWDEC